MSNAIWLFMKHGASVARRAGREEREPNQPKTEASHFFLANQAIIVTRIGPTKTRPIVIPSMAGKLSSFMHWAIKVNFVTHEFLSITIDKVAAVDLQL